MQDGVRHELRGGDRDPVQAGVRVQVQARLQDGLQEVLHHRARRGVQVRGGGVYLHMVWV